MPPTEARKWLPSYWPKLKKLALANKQITPSNFVDVLAEVYTRRPAFYVDQPLEYSFFKGDEITYSTLLRFVNRIGNGLLKLGARPGDRIALITMNRLELAFAEYAALKIGCIPVPFNFLLKINELKYQIENSGAKILFTDRNLFENTIKDRANLPFLEHWIMVTKKAAPAGFISFSQLMDDSLEELAPYPEFNPDDIGMIFYTSGTTGLPRGAALTKRAFIYPIRRASMISSLVPFNRNQLALLVMPIAHSGGNQNMLLLLAIGIPMYFVGRFNPTRILEMIQEYQATFFAGIPTMYKMLIAAGADKYDLSSIRLFGGGADAFADDLVENMRNLASRKFLGLTLKPLFVRGYGLAETNSTLTLTPPWSSGENCIGFTVPGFKYRIVGDDGKDVKKGEVGEFICQGPTVMREYWNDPEKTRNTIKDGWFHTGDMMKKGKYGMLYFMDRGKDIIKCSGWPIYPTELEKVLEQHPDIERACVIASYDQVKGQLPVALVILRPNAPEDPEALHAWAKERLAAYKCPRYLCIVDTLPLTISLKTKKVELRALYEDAVKNHGGHANRKLSFK